MQALIDYLVAGRPLDEFLDDFPSVTREQTVAALEEAKLSECWCPVRVLCSQNFVIVVMVARSNDIGDLRPLLPHVLKALETASPGGITRVQI